MSTLEGSSSIADSSGNLLFYTDGINIWNKNHIVMPNGSGLLSDESSTQAALIVKQPGINPFYYVFTTDAFEFSNGLQYNIVDMTLQGGLGDVSLLNAPLNTPCDEKICAVGHANGVDVWLINSASYGDTIYAYRITPAGLNPAPVISPIRNVNDPFNFAGQLKASPLGNKLAVCLPDSGFEIYDFDNATGAVSNPVSIFNYPYIYGAYGIEFSPDGSRLYGSLHSDHKIYQFDLLAGSPSAIVASATLISSIARSYGSLQLAPDNKIYVAEVGGNSIGVINDPNQLGTACNFVNSSISISGSCIYGLPNFQTPPANLQSVDFSQKEGLSLKLYPNPSEAELNVEISSSIESVPVISVYNLLAEKVNVVFIKRQGSENYFADVSGLSQGIYYVEVACVNKRCRSVMMKK